ncbi:MAG: hypothetical protein AAGI46_04515 [Planctomycetota bacterium]
MLVLFVAWYNAILTYSNPFHYDGDALQHNFWVQSFWASRLTDIDPIARFYASDAMSPMGYRWLMQLMGSIGEIQRVAETAMIGLTLATGWMFYVLGRRAAGSSWGGLILVGCIMWFAIFYERPFGSTLLQRHFAPIIIAGGLWGLVSRNVWAVGAAFLASALFYPITLAVLGLTAVLHEVIRLVIDKRMPKGWWLAVLLGLAALGVMIARDVPAEYGQRVTADVARSMDVFHEGGRAQYWIADRETFLFTHHRSGLGHKPIAFIKAAIFLVPLLALSWRKASLAGGLLLAVGVLIWALAILFPFHLYLPNRHVRMPLPIGYSLLLATTIPAAFVTLRGWVERLIGSPQDTAGMPWARLALGVIVPVAGVVWFVNHFRAPAVRMWTYNQAVSERGPELPRYVERYLRALAPETFVAGHPADVSHIPLLTGRPTIASRKTLNPYFPDFYHEVLRPRAEDSVRAYYAADWEDVDRLHELYGVSVFYDVAGDQRTKGHYYEEEPLNSMSLEALDRLGDRPRVLANPPADRVIVRDELRGITLIRVGPLDAVRVRNADGSTSSFFSNPKTAGS